MTDARDPDRVLLALQRNGPLTAARLGAIVWPLLASRGATSREMARRLRPLVRDGLITHDPASHTYRRAEAVSA